MVVFGRLAINPPAIAQSLDQNQALLIDPRQEFEFEWSFAFLLLHYRRYLISPLCGDRYQDKCDGQQHPRADFCLMR